MLTKIKEGCFVALTAMACWALFVLAPACAGALNSINRLVWNAGTLVDHADTVVVKTAPDVAATLVAVRSIAMDTAKTMKHVEGVTGDAQKMADDAAKPKTKAQKAENWLKLIIAGGLRWL